MERGYEHINPSLIIAFYLSQPVHGNVPPSAEKVYHYVKYRRFFDVIQYRKILELYHKGMSQRSISASEGTSRQTVSKVILQAKEKEIEQLTDEMINPWLKSFYFPSQTPKGRGFVEEDWHYVHEQLKKKHMTLRLLHKEYELRVINDQRLAYSYRTYCQHYNDYAKTHRLTMPIKSKPVELMEIDWAGETLTLRDRLSVTVKWF